jgi:predicted CopG family antitoxin
MLAPLEMVGMAQSETTIGVSNETYELVKSCKRGGESFDTLLRKMAKDYEPEERDQQ